MAAGSRWSGRPAATSSTAFRTAASTPRRELRELVAFAADRGVRIVPEIDLPGHVRAALAAYPELGNRPEVRLPVWTAWGISPRHPRRPRRRVRLLPGGAAPRSRDVFPAPYLHIGGDECPTTQWASSPVARAKAAQLELGGTAELHPWFLGELHRFLADLGRQAVCWDETGQPRAGCRRTWSSRPGATPRTAPSPWPAGTR